MTAIGAAVIAGVFLLLSAVVPSLIGLATRRHLLASNVLAVQARTAAESVATHIGEPNGRGDVTTMLTAILDWQDAHSAEDVQRMAAVEAELAALSVYSHTRFHDVLNALTVTKGKTDLLWMAYEQEGKTK